MHIAPFRPKEDLAKLLKVRVSSSALWRALRCSTSTGVPALLGALTGNASFGWAALGGFEVTIADLGDVEPIAPPGWLIDLCEFCGRACSKWKKGRARSSRPLCI